MTFFRKIDIAKVKKFFIVLLLIVSMTFAPIHAQKAHAAWGEIVAQVFKTVMEYLKGMIKGLINSALKTAAVKAISKEMSNIVGGSSSQDAKFITNWRSYIVDKPRLAANKYMNDYVSQSVGRGRGSISGYVSTKTSNLFSANYEGFGNGSFSYGLAMNNPSFGKFSYITQAAEITNSSGNAAITDAQRSANALAATSEQKPRQVTYNGENITDAKDNFYNFNLYLSGINSSWTSVIDAQQVYDQKLKEEQSVAQSQGVANQGFTGSGEGDQVTTPGILVKDAMANVQDIGNKILSQAQEPQEVITAVVQQMVTQAMTNGIGKAKAVAQKEVQSVKDQASQKINDQAQSQGIGSVFKGGSFGGGGASGSY